MYHIFLETLNKIQQDVSSHHDPQECQDDQECPPSTGRFLMAIFQIRPYVLYIFGNLRQNPVQ